MATAPLYLRGFPFLHRIHLNAATKILLPPYRSYCTAPTESTQSSDELSSTDKDKDKDKSKSTGTVWLSTREPPKYHRWDDPDYRKWRDKEDEILREIRPVVLRAKDVLHSDKYLDGERLSTDDEKFVVEKLLAYHPHSEDKIGCGLDCIMVDRHPRFRRSRCLFVVRTDGGWIDFSYQKCLRAYIRSKYPSHAERFIKEHLKRGGS